MRAVDVIRTKRDGHTLSRAAIQEFVMAAATDTWPDYQLSAMLMAIFQRGMNTEETATLTELMTNSGRRYRWDDIPGPKVDKHSTGGVGDKTSLVLAPIAAACGVIVPMMSGRGLGHSGGTLDKLEAIPGFRVNLSEAELRQNLRQIGVGMIGQSAEVAPADRKLYALRDVTATVECIPLITASILSKKIAEGIDSLVMDIKVGRGAFMKTLQDAQTLARTIVSVGIQNGLKTHAYLTQMDSPLGNMVGNSVEVLESIEVLKGNGPKDTAALSILLAARMIQLGHSIPMDEATQLAQKAITSGDALERFQQLIISQGGDPRVIDSPALLPRAPKQFQITATRAGYVTGLDAYNIGVAATILGAGRLKATDHVHPGIGIRIITPLNTQVTVGEAILEVYYAEETHFPEALKLLHDAITLGDAPFPTVDLVIESVESVIQTPS